MAYTWAKKLGMVRKPANFISSISNDRDMRLCGVLALLRFRRQLPKACSKVIELILMVTADHGSARSGAHNTIVRARAGKDLVSALCSGLLTIGCTSPRIKEEVKTATLTSGSSSFAAIVGLSMGSFLAVVGNTLGKASP